jgi:5-formyltetrahydrofolate cyclo-ligase
MMDVTAWRREQRLRLYAARKAMTAEQRHDAARKISGGLDDLFVYHKPALVGLYWPIKYEPNLLSWARTQAQTFRFCLPVVVWRGQPLEYWLWMPGDQTQSGVWDIQIPARREVVTPDLMIAPLLGFDRARYRLGNGRGYFDRTLAVLRDRPFVIGVGYASSELETIHPQPHDIAMNLILTERS